MSSAYSQKINTGISSTPNFNALNFFEGPRRENFAYIEEHTNTKIVMTTTHLNAFDSKDETIVLIISATNEKDLQEGVKLCDNLILTTKAKKKQVEEKFSIGAKKPKAGKPNVILPQQLLLAMRYYFPGGPAEPAPPGSSKDFRTHRMNFQQVGKHEQWFRNYKPQTSG